MDDTPEIIEAISHCNEIANSSENCDCAKDHIQLAKWLNELVLWRQEHAPVSHPALEVISINCLRCANHPKNGGSGICHCILGTTPIC